MTPREDNYALIVVLVIALVVGFKARESQWRRCECIEAVPAEEP